MIPLAPLWADAGEWVKIAFVLVPVVVYALNRLLSGEGQQQKPPLRRPEQAPRPAPKPVAAPAERKRIDDEVGDFLRRAAQQRAAAQGQPAQRSQPAAAAAPKPARRPLVERPVATRPVEVEAVEVEVLDDVQAGRSVAAHVQQHLGRRTVAQRGPRARRSNTPWRNCSPTCTKPSITRSVNWPREPRRRTRRRPLRRLTPNCPPPINCASCWPAHRAWVRRSCWARSSAAPKNAGRVSKGVGSLFRPTR